jgi:hypothetical protein
LSYVEQIRLPAAVELEEAILHQTAHTAIFCESLHPWLANEEVTGLAKIEDALLGVEVQVEERHH